MGMTMSNTKLYGLDKVRRTCAIQVATQNGNSKTVKITSCIGAKGITLISAIKTVFPVTFFANITLTQLELDTTISVTFTPGSTAQFEDLEVKKMRWNINFKGPLSTFNPLMNAVANGRIGRAAVKMAKSAIKKAIQKEMDKHPL